MSRLHFAVAVVGLSTISLVGCANKDAHQSRGGDAAGGGGGGVMDVAVAAPGVTTAAYDPTTVATIPVQPAPSPSPAVPVDVTTTAVPAGGAASAYTVRRGDTLYGIARNTYGDGKQWRRIAAANPGVTPQALRVGQTLQIP